MSVFMKNGFQRNVLQQRKHNQVFIAATLEKCRQVRGPPMIEREVRLEGLLAGKNHHDNRRRSHSLRPRQQRIGLAELFEPFDKTRHLLRITATVGPEMRRLYLKPSLLQERLRLRNKGDLALGDPGGEGEEGGRKAFTQGLRQDE